MSLNSVNTNMGAMVALESLDSTNSQLSSVQKQISTGYKVADATDNGGAFAVAQRVRSDVASLTTVNDQLGGTQGLISTTLTGLTDSSNQLNSVGQVLTELADGSISSTERAQYQQQFTSDVTQLKNMFSNATYNGKSLIGGVNNGTASGATVIQNESGGTYGIASFGGLQGALGATTFTYASASAFLTSLSSLETADSTKAQAAMTATGTLSNLKTAIGSALNYYGSASSYIDTTISYNSDKIDALNSGLGSLVDADLAQESAQLQSLQIKQQLGEHALSIANQAPQTLLSLFK